MSARNAQRGFSLLELLIVLSILMLISALAIAQLKPTHEPEKLLQSVARKLAERRSSALKLAPRLIKLNTSLDNYIAPPPVYRFQRPGNHQSPDTSRKHWSHLRRKPYHHLP